MFRRLSIALDDSCSQFIGSAQRNVFKAKVLLNIGRRWRRQFHILSPMLASMVVFLAILLSVATTPSVLAGPVIFTYTGTGTGTIDATPFSDVRFTITALGDTTNREGKQVPYWIYWIDHNSASISIDGIGCYQITVPTRTFVNTVFAGPGFSFAGSNGYDLFDGFQNPAFATWDMLTSIGPISGDAWFFGYPIETSGGNLLFEQLHTVGTFEATVVPEPSTLILLGIGVIGLLGFSWRKWRAA